MTDYNDLIDKARKGDQRSLGRLARLIDDNQDGAGVVVSRLFPQGGNAHIVGITGPPGAGKSTLVNALVREWRKTDRRIGVLAVDPTSPFSGGAVLGDRIRMQEHATDPGVFIRSLATRGHLGGLSRSVLPLITLLDATGFDTIVLETVGVGQEEVEIKDLAHTTVFVTVPGLGDGIQAMKAGILEIADVYLVNKMDLPHAESAVKDLQSMLLMSTQRSAWVPPVLRTIALEAEGIPELTEIIAAHWTHLRDSDGLKEWSARSAEMSITEAFREAVEDRVLKVVSRDNDEFNEDVRKVSNREEDPASVAARWLSLAKIREEKRMDFYDVIKARRSCRVFSPDPVGRDVLERVVDAAQWAPSGKNRQNWRIYVVRGQKKDELVQVADRSFPRLEPGLKKLYDERVVEFTRGFFKTLGGAPVLMVFYSKPTDEGPFVDTQSISAAIENALLAAAYEGLGACWMTGPVHLKNEVDSLLGVEGMDLIAFVPIGYPGKEPPVPPRKEGRVEWIGF